MTGGGLTVNSYAHVGNSGTGNFIQSGGTNAIFSELDLGCSSGGNGTYSLSGSGRLSASGEDVGDASYSTGNLTQSGGSNAITSNFYLGDNSGGSGTYNLSGGSLSAPK